jgi:hypothetical protein
MRRNMQMFSPGIRGQKADSDWRLIAFCIVPIDDWAIIIDTGKNTYACDNNTYRNLKVRSNFLSPVMSPLIRNGSGNTVCYIA